MFFFFNVVLDFFVWFVPFGALSYVIVIARDRVQYEIYFPSSDIFVSLFSEPSGEENNNKNIRTRKIYPYCTSNMR